MTLEFSVSEKALIQYLNYPFLCKSLSPIFALYSNGSTHYLKSKIELHQDENLFNENLNISVYIIDNDFDIYLFHHPSKNIPLGRLAKVNFCNVHLSNLEIKKVYRLPNSFCSILTHDNYLYNPYYFGDIDYNKVLRIKVPDNCEKIIQIKNSETNTFVFKIDSIYVLYLPIFDREKRFDFDENFEVKSKKVIFKNISRKEMKRRSWKMLKNI